MVPCESCGRHLRASEVRCPFCASPSSARRALQFVGASLTTIVLAACYGTPAPGPGEGPATPGEPAAASAGGTAEATAPNDAANAAPAAVVDADGDGHAADVDCNDADAQVFSGAQEDCANGKDDDCDGRVDAADESCAAPKPG